MSLPFFITDVFAEGPFAGNQLATVGNAGQLSTEEMQQIALAFNFAETSFVTGGDHTRGFDVRIFTPAEELPFAGHPTLGTAYLLRHELLSLLGGEQEFAQKPSNGNTQDPSSAVSEISLNLGVGPINVSFADDGVIWMRQYQPAFGQHLTTQQAATSLGLEIDQIDSRYPVQYVSTGVEFLIVPVRSLADLRAIRVSHQPCAPAILAFCPGGYVPEQALATRMFSAAMGIAEDAATGSANGCLAAYLLQHEYFGGPEIDLKVGQGYEIKRPSQLYLRAGTLPVATADKQLKQFVINVGGRVRLVARGEWLV